MCISVSTYAQNIRHKLDSLIAEVPNVEDTARVVLLCDISGDYFNIDQDSSIAYGERALELAKELNYIHGLAISNQVIGRCYALQNKPSEALTYLQEALGYARKINSKQVNHDVVVANILLTIGQIYKQKGDISNGTPDDYKKALDYYIQAKDAYKQAGKSPVYVLNAIGGLHLAGLVKLNEQEQLAKIKLAQAAYSEAIEEESKEGHSTKMLAMLYSQLGNTYCLQDNLPKGIELLKKALSIQQDMGDEKSAAYSIANIGYFYFQGVVSNCRSCTKDMKNTRKTLPMALNYLKRSAELAERLDIKSLLVQDYKNISDVYVEMRQYKDAMNYYKRFVAIQDSLRDFAEERKFAQVEAQYAVKQKTDSLKFANELKDKEIDQRKTERNGTMTILALVGISAVLFINRQNIRRKKLKAEKELADSNLALADSKLKKAQERLDSFTQNLREKNQLIENFSAEIERLQALPCSNELPDTKENLIKLQNSIILTEEQWDNFKYTFEEVHSGFLYRLRENMPDLTPAETRFMALTKLRLTNKEMAGMLGVGDAAVRNYKYRLLKKLDLPSESDINEVVDSI
ncbi:MAG: hypothetical protein H6550_08675 [Chitinophagales bacterium]|nr:hypothetical protein [Chitinophagales bacterium]